MKEKFRTLLAYVLCLCLCASAIMPVHAANENNTQGVTFSAALDTPSIQVSDQDQTVVMRVTASEGVSLAGIGGTIVWDDVLTLNAITNDDENISFTGCVDITTGKIDFFDSNLTTFSNVTSIAVATFTVPAGTPAGTYKVGMSDIELVSKDESSGTYVAWESTATATAVLTVTEAAVSENYTVGVSVLSSAVSVGEKVSVNVNVSHVSDTVFNGSEIVLGYDSAMLTFNESGSTLNGATVSAADGVLKLEDYGADQACADAAYILVFDAAASGATTITLNSAAFGDSADAETIDLTPATISVASASVTISNQRYTVTLPEIFTGAEEVEDGSSYTFYVADGDNYDYDTVTATVTVDGEGVPATVIDNGDGSYTIENVTGELVITGTRTGKSYNVSFAGDGAADMSGVGTTATYGTDYEFGLPATEGYTYRLSGITIGGTAYTGYTESDSTYTIPGTAITGDIVITVGKEEILPDTVTITVGGSGVGAADGYETTVDYGADYTLTIEPESGYDYTVTATMGGENVEVTDNGDNTYTVKGVTDALAFTVERTVNTDGVSVAQYLTLDSSIMWLVANTVTLADGKVPTYNGANMFWSEKYSAYCCLVVAETLAVEDAKELVGIAGGEAVSVDYGMDVNNSGIVDANDAQLTYNMYNAMYAGFTDNVTMVKYLRADVNGDKLINVEDAAAIISSILGTN